MTATYSKPLAFSHNCLERMQENVTDVDHYGGVQVTDPECNIDSYDVETNNTHHMLDASVIGSSVNDLTYDSKMVGNVNQDNTTHNGGYTMGRADCSVGVPVIHPDYDMGCEDMDNIIPTIQSCRSYITSPIVDLTDEFSKEGELTEKKSLMSMNLSVPFSRRRTCNFFRMQDTNHCVTMTMGS
jgi:hypothetical protein